MGLKQKYMVLLLHSMLPNNKLVCYSSIGVAKQ